MRKEDTLEVLKSIADYYPAFTFEQRTFDAWHRVLVNYEFESITGSLSAYVLVNDFPPKISQLVRNVSFNDPAYKIPNKEETRAYFDKLDAEIAEAKANPISIEERDKLIEDALGTAFLNRLKAKRG